MSAAVVGCAPDRVAVRLDLDAACAGDGLSCGGEIGVRLFDASDGTELSSVCAPFGAAAGHTFADLAADLAAAGELEIERGADVIAEVVVWSPATEASCPRYDGVSMPRPNYFGSSLAIQLDGDAPAIHLPVVCRPSPACVACARYASPQGDDLADGARDAPVRTVERLLRVVTPGEAGCLLDGVYDDAELLVERSGEPGAPLTLTSAPGAHATIRGRLDVPATVHHVTVANLLFEGIGGKAVVIFGDDIEFVGNEIVRSDGEGIELGDDEGTGVFAERVVVDGNRIHGCPATDPAVSLSLTRGAQVTNNIIYDNGRHGIELWPDADDSVIERNIVDGNANGISFSGGTSVASDNNVVRLNVFSNATTGYNVTRNFNGPVGVGNMVTDNCVWNGAMGDIAEPTTGFTASNNLVRDPQYVDRANKDFRLAADSPCADKAPAPALR